MRNAIDGRLRMGRGFDANSTKIPQETMKRPVRMTIKRPLLTDAVEKLRRLSHLVPGFGLLTARVEVIGI